MGLTARTLGRSPDDERGLLDEAVAQMVYAALDEPSTVVATGLDDLNRILGGGLGAGVHLVAGVGGVGRTSFALSVVLQAARDGHATVLVVHDDDRLGVAQRLLAMAVRIERPRLFAADPEVELRREQGQRELEALPISVLHGDRLEPWSIGWSIRDASSTFDATPTLLVIDGLDRLVRGTARAGTVRGLADLASALNLAVLITTAADFAPSARGDRPAIRDVADWPSLKPHLRSATVLYRDDQYDVDSPDKGIGELRVDWHANGPTGIVMAAFLHHLADWRTLARRGSASSSIRSDLFSCEALGGSDEHSATVR